MSNILKEKKQLPDIMITSPAIRALTTALIFARNFKYPVKNMIVEESIYHAGNADDYINVLQKVDNVYKSAMLFGHNPTITAACNHLNTFFIDHLPTTGVACIDFKISHLPLEVVGSNIDFYDDANSAMTAFDNISGLSPTIIRIYTTTFQDFNGKK